MGRNIRRPDRFASWADYEDQYRVDVDRDDWAMRCRACGEVWVIPQNRGKMLQRAHVCPNACNGKPRARSGRGAPASVVERQRDAHERTGHGFKGWEYDGYDHGGGYFGSTRKPGTKLWFTFRQVGKRPGLSVLLHELEEGRVLGDDSFLEVLDAQ